MKHYEKNYIFCFTDSYQWCICLLYTSALAAVAPGLRIVDNINMGSNPVSYTHLDVYKRQDENYL